MSQSTAITGGAAKPSSSREKRLPSLDGLRAVAALMVVFAHSEATEGWPNWFLLEELRKTLSGFVGVQIFFIISGFIITRLLLVEKDQSGGVALKRFWGRRFLRIVPPLAIYLGTLSLLKYWGFLHVSTLSQVGSLFFFRNHLPQDDMLNAHCWSLSVEEQFYLIWPFCVAFLRLGTLKRIALAVFAISFASRLTAVLTGETEWRWLVFHADCLMGGALAAIWIQNHGLTAVKPLSKSSSMFHLLALLVILVVSRICATRYSGYFTPYQSTLVATFGAVWIARLVSSQGGLVYKFLNLRVMIWLGSISYSMYLWQQFMSAPAEDWLKGTPWFAHFPLNVLMSIVAGALSFYCFERPFQKLRHRWHSWLGAKPPAAASTP